MSALSFSDALAIIEKDQPSASDAHIASTDWSRERPKKKPKLGEGQGAMGKNDFDLTMKVEKMDEDQNLVFGWASVISQDGKPVIDSQGDIIEEAELEKAFYDFAVEGRQADEMHDWSEGGPLVECMVFTKEKQEALGIDLKKIGAWVGFRVRPDIFAKVKSGEYPSFSIGGSGERVPVTQ